MRSNGEGGIAANAAAAAAAASRANRSSSSSCCLRVSFFFGAPAAEAEARADEAGFAELIARMMCVELRCEWTIRLRAGRVCVSLSQEQSTASEQRPSRTTVTDKRAGAVECSDHSADGLGSHTQRGDELQACGDLVCFFSSSRPAAHAVAAVRLG